MNEECDSYLFLGLYLHRTIICNYSLLRQNVLLDFQRFEKLNPHHFTSTQVFRHRPQWNMWVRALYLQISFEIETAWQRCKYLGVGLNMGYHGTTGYRLYVVSSSYSLHGNGTFTSYGFPIEPLFTTDFPLQCLITRR